MSYEAYKDYRLAEGDNGCWDVLDSNYESKGTYPSKAAAKRAIDDLSLPHPHPSYIEQLEDICYRMYENSGNSKYIRAEWAGKPYHPDTATQEIKSLIENITNEVIGEDMIVTSEYDEKHIAINESKAEQRNNLKSILGGGKDE